jgi:hypothetical protein
LEGIAQDDPREALLGAIVKKGNVQTTLIFYTTNKTPLRAWLLPVRHKIPRY